MVVVSLTVVVGSSADPLEHAAVTTENAMIALSKRIDVMVGPPQASEIHASTQACRRLPLTGSSPASPSGSSTAIAISTPSGEDLST